MEGGTRSVSKEMPNKNLLSTHPESHRVLLLEMIYYRFNGRLHEYDEG